MDQNSANKINKRNIKSAVSSENQTRERIKDKAIFIKTEKERKPYIYGKKGVQYDKHINYEIVHELSVDYSVKLLCDVLEVNRSGYYKWCNRIKEPSKRTTKIDEDVKMFSLYHDQYPSHGYRWLNAIIQREKHIKMSNKYAYKCCKIAGIKSKSNHLKYNKHVPYNIKTNLIHCKMQINKPLECVVSDATSFYVHGIEYELILFMDLFNHEILTYRISRKKDNVKECNNAIRELGDLKEQYSNLEMVLHTDRGALYTAKDMWDILPVYGIVHSMSRGGMPTDNAVMEAINGWIKDEMFCDLHIIGNDDIEGQVKKYIQFFNERRPAYALNYMTPVQYKQYYYNETHQC